MSAFITLYIGYICNNEDVCGSDLFKEEFLCFSLSSFFLTAALLCVCWFAVNLIAFLLCVRTYVPGSTHFLYVFEKYYQPPPRAIDEGMGSKKRANKEEEEEGNVMKEKKKKTTKKKVSDIDDIFGKVVKKKKTEKKNESNEEGDGGARNNSNNNKKKKEKEGYVKILLPGQKKPKGKRLNSKGEEVPEFTPVDKPRRMEDGLPVYKSYDDFTDMKHGQQKVDSKGRVLGPNGEPGGKCPFDCWCCF